ncbi:hypothetical protein [Actinomadura sp. 6N118]|uniref:hypothetical protein n=1 Tax=Actinomadura sp. 6N118 TaxID=3375151 RepID=UPI003795518C
MSAERPDAVVEAIHGGRVAARTVIWLNEAQFYLQPAQVGEQVAVELQALLSDPERGPILVLGSIWPQFWHLLCATPSDRDGSESSDPHQAARTLLGQAVDVTAPVGFTDEQLAEQAVTIRGDRRLQVAAERARGGRLTQELAGAPELLRRYEHAAPATKTVVWAAMDARRLGHGLYLPEPLLQHAAPGYLDTDAWDQIAGLDWFSAALNDLTATHRRLPGPLTERHPRPGESLPPYRLYRLADYLEQHGRVERALICPPATFWTAATRYSGTSSDQFVLAHAAIDRGRYRHGDDLFRSAAASSTKPTTRSGLRNPRLQSEELGAVARMVKVPASQAVIKRCDHSSGCCAATERSPAMWLRGFPAVRRRSWVAGMPRPRGSGG